MQDKNVIKLTDQDAALLEQGASMLEGLENDERNRGNCSTAEGAGCSAHAVRRLASALLAHEREIDQCLHQIQEPAAAVQAAWHAGQDEGRAQAARPVVVPDDMPSTEANTKYGESYGVDWVYEGKTAAPAAVAWSMPAEPTEQMIEVLMAGEDRLRARNGDDLPKQRAKDRYRALLSLAATPAAAPVDKSPELQGSVVDKTVNLQDAAAAPVVPHEPDRIARNLMQFVGLDKDTARKCQEVVRCALLATATGLPAQAVEQAPVLYVSKEQLDSHTDHADSEAGRYLPCRITPAGKFITPLFPVPHSQEFQQRVQPWMMACFGSEISADRRERNHRFLEEALETVQCLGCTASEAHQLVDYVYGRPWGEPAQEVGGVMVTLAALCLANGLDMHAAGDTELARIWTMVEAIRAKQAAKPKHSPLPMHAPQAQADAQDAVAFKAAIEKLPRYTYGFKSDDWGMGSHLQSYQDPEGKFLNREEVIAAIAAAKGE